MLSVNLNTVESLIFPVGRLCRFKIEAYGWGLLIALTLFIFFGGVKMTVFQGATVALMCFLTVFAALGGVYLLVKAITLLFRAFSQEGKEA